MSDLETRLARLEEAVGVLCEEVAALQTEKPEREDRLAAGFARFMARASEVQTDEG